MCYVLLFKCNQLFDTRRNFESKTQSHTIYLIFLLYIRKIHELYSNNIQVSKFQNYT